MTVRAQSPGRTALRDPAVALWVIAGACWAAAVAAVATGNDRFVNHAEIVEQSTLLWPVRIAVFAALWAVMVAAMMLPTTVPMARLVFVVTARAPKPSRSRVALLASYLAVWVGFGVVALAGDRGVHGVVDSWPWLDEHSGLIVAGTLGLAGGFQFSGLKDRCLTACRDPLTMLWRHYGRGVGAAWRLGWHHAMNCLGCCWALMLLMFGVGIGSLTWMLGLTAVMVAEKTTRWGARMLPVVGVALLVVAAAYALGALDVPPFAPALSGGIE